MSSAKNWRPRLEQYRKLQQIAAAMYRAYSKQAGGKTFDGKPLPTYEELGADRQACWEAAAKEAVAQVAAISAITQEASA